MNAKQLETVWRRWRHFRAEHLLPSVSIDDVETGDVEIERQLVSRLAASSHNLLEQAVWLRSLVDLCGLTVRQVSSFFQIEPQVIVQSISLLAMPVVAAGKRTSDRVKRRRRAA